MASDKDIDERDDRGDDVATIQDEEVFTSSEEYKCYVLLSVDGRKTYVGITNNMKRRLRQHNGEICGGAKYTGKPDSRPWSVAFTITGFRTKIEALQFEWAFHHTKGPSGLKGRTVKLHTLLRKRQWTRSSPPAPSVPLTIQVYPGVEHDMLVTKLSTHLPVHCTVLA